MAKRKMCFRCGSVNGVPKHIGLRLPPPLELEYCFSCGLNSILPEPLLVNRVLSVAVKRYAKELAKIQHFYQERGVPIDISTAISALNALSEELNGLRGYGLTSQERQEAIDAIEEACKRKPRTL